MANYKRQHYLPAAYLRNFSIDGEHSTRKSILWRLDHRARRRVTVASQGFSDYFYSEDLAESVEREFKVGEDFYAACYSDFWKRDAPSTRKKALGLLLLMLDLNIRNVAYAKSRKNNYGDYRSMSAIVKFNILWGKKTAPPDDEAIASEASRNWNVVFVRCSDGNAFISSDNPSMIAYLGPGDGFVNLVLMPVTPSIYAVGYDSRFLRASPGKVSVRDEATLNQMQVKNCLKCIYTRENINDSEWAGLKQLLAGRRPRVPVEGEGLWGAEIFHIPTGGLEFVQIRSGGDKH